tara:strand:+ start:1736 stop:2161 length:426 start_codon:yes stop_codon:yes gene_type:complete
MSKYIRTVYLVGIQETNINFYSVEAKSKKEALMVVEGNYDISHTEWVRSNQPKIMEVTKYDECPHIGNAWTDIPLKDTLPGGKKKVGGWGWHYNGTCSGEKKSDQDFCYVCVRAMNKGFRFLSVKEKNYLIDTYGKGDIWV